MKSKYCLISNSIVRNPNINGNDFRVFSVILSYAFSGDFAPITHLTLMNDTGIGNKRTLIKSIDNLLDMGLIFIERGKGGESNKYKINEKYLATKKTD